MGLPLLMRSTTAPQVVHTRPGYSVTIGPDASSGLASHISITGTAPAGVVLEIEDAQGTEAVSLGGLTGQRLRSRSLPPLATRLR